MQEGMPTTADQDGNWSMYDWPKLPAPCTPNECETCTTHVRPVYASLEAMKVDRAVLCASVVAPTHLVGLRAAACSDQAVA
jgi:hypothetical protein